MLLAALASREIQEMAECRRQVDSIKDMNLLLQLYRHEDGVSLRMNPIQRHVDEIKVHQYMLEQKLIRYCQKLQNEYDLQMSVYEPDDTIQDLQKRIAECVKKSKYWSKELAEVERKMIKIRRKLEPVCELNKDGKLT